MSGDCSSAVFCSVSLADKATVFSPIQKPYNPKKNLLFMDLEGVACCGIRAAQLRPAMWLRRDIIDFLCRVKAHYNVYLLTDLTRTPPDVLIKIIARLLPLGVLGACLISKKKHPDFRGLFSSLKFRPDSQVWLVRSLDHEIRTSQEAIRVLEESAHDLVPHSIFIFPHKIKPHLVFSRNVYFDVEVALYLHDSPEEGLVNPKGTSLASVEELLLREKPESCLRKPGPFTVELKSADLQKMKDLITSDRVLKNRSEIVNKLVAKALDAEGLSRDKLIPPPDSRELLR